MAATVTILAFASGSAVGEITREEKLAKAWNDLEVVEDLLGHDGTSNELIVTTLDAVVDAAVALDFSAKGDADEAQLAYAQSLERYRQDVLDVLLDAIDEVALDREGNNRREPVNLRAGRLLRRTVSFLDDAGRRRLSRRIIHKIRRFERMRHEVDADVYGAAFLALAELGEPRSVEWIRETYVRAKQQPADIARLRVALHALGAFRNLTGTQRHALVDEMLKRYVAMESLANISTTDVSALAARRFWEAVGSDVIRLMQHLSGQPKNAQGEALETMKAFADWYREHDDPDDAPWSTFQDATEAG